MFQIAQINKAFESSAKFYAKLLRCLQDSFFYLQENSLFCGQVPTLSVKKRYKVTNWGLILIAEFFLPTRNFNFF